jgi:hypothetical protein
MKKANRNKFNSIVRQWKFVQDEKEPWLINPRLQLDLGGPQTHYFTRNETLVTALSG